MNKKNAEEKSTQKDFMVLGISTHFLILQVIILKLTYFIVNFSVHSLILNKNQKTKTPL